MTSVSDGYKPMVKSKLPWRDDAGGFNPSWLADSGPSLVFALRGSQHVERTTVHRCAQYCVSKAYQYGTLVTAGADR
jgi:hypothetical protein